MALLRLGIEAAWRSACDRLGGMTLDQFALATEDFDVTPLIYGGACVGAMLIKGKEVHACVTPPWYARQAVRVIDEVIDRHGEATTHATTEAGRVMVEKLGFRSENGIYRKVVKHGH